MRKRIAEALFQRLVFAIAGQRPPNLVVGTEDPQGAYLLRWYVTPWRGWFAGIAPENMTWWQRAVHAVVKRLPNLYLHKFLRDDDDRALHDHPSWAVSFILRRGYIEHTIADGGIHHRREYGPGSLRFMRTRHTHRIELHTDTTTGTAQPCWTLFLFGPRCRDWGFHCPERGWVPWQKFTAEGKPGEIGKGCDA